MAIDLSGYEKGNPRSYVIATSLKEDEIHLVEDLIGLLDLKNTADLLRYCINATITHDPNVLLRFRDLDDEARDEYPFLESNIAENYTILIEDDNG